MNDDKLKELEKFFKETIWSLGRNERLAVLDLITDYRQLEKDNVKLLAALKPFGDAFVERERLYKKGTVEAIWKLVETGNYETAHQVYTKHKGESE